MGDVEEALAELLERAPGLFAILISTPDGIPLIKVVDPAARGSPLVAGRSTETKFASTFAVAAKQASNMKLSKLRSITAFYNQSIIHHVDTDNMIITFLAHADGNAGVIRQLGPAVTRALESLKASLPSIGMM